MMTGAADGAGSIMPATGDRLLAPPRATCRRRRPPRRTSRSRTGRTRNSPTGCSRHRGPAGPQQEHRRPAVTSRGTGPGQAASVILPVLAIRDESEGLCGSRCRARPSTSTRRPSPPGPPRAGSRPQGGRQTGRALSDPCGPFGRPARIRRSARSCPPALARSAPGPPQAPGRNAAVRSACRPSLIRPYTLPHQVSGRTVKE